MAVDLDAAAEHYRQMLKELGIEGGDNKTAVRYVRALAEFTNGNDPETYLTTQFQESETQPRLIVVTDVPFVSICEHHMLPFWGSATIGYVTKPHGRIVGLSKLPRALQAIAARPQLQERLTSHMADVLMKTLDAAGSAVTVRGVHTCMALRGVRTGLDATMLTTVRRGVLEEESAYRREFDSISLRGA